MLRTTTRKSQYRCPSKDVSRRIFSSTHQPRLEHRSVAGSFLLKFPPQSPSSPSSSPLQVPSQGPLIALFRRSANLKTYPGKLAPLAGSIEATDPSPFHAALREIREETCLPPSQLRHVATGKPYSFTDDSLTRRWTIHPFAFELVQGEAAEAQIVLDHEHESWEWYYPREATAVIETRGVPNLLESFRRVWVDVDVGEQVGSVVRAGIAEMRATDDHEGALATKSLHLLMEVLRLYQSTADLADEERRARWWKNVRFLAWHIWMNGAQGVDHARTATLRALQAMEAHKSEQDVVIQDMIDDLDNQLAVPWRQHHVADVDGAGDQAMERRMFDDL